MSDIHELSAKVAALETRLHAAEQLAEDMRDDAAYHRKLADAWQQAGNRMWTALTGEAVEVPPSTLEAKVRVLRRHRHGKGNVRAVKQRKE